MRILIAVLSCINYSKNGINQAQRNTWLRDVPHYVFTLGDGTGVQESPEFLNSWNGRSCRYANANVEVRYLPQYVEKRDEVVFSVPDDYMHTAYKSREVVRWALSREFDHVFHCCTDTYVHFDRLLSSDFSKFSLYGGCNGGEGQWVDKRAMEILADSPIDTWSEDGWRIEALAKKGIFLERDMRYTTYPRYPKKYNDLITSHLNICPGIYQKEVMYSIYEGLR